MGKNIGVKFAIGATMQSTVASSFATVDAKVKSLKANFKELSTVSSKAAALVSADSMLKDARTQYSVNPTEKQAKALASAERAYKSAERSAKKYNITTADAAKIHAKAEAAIKSTTSALERQAKIQANSAKRKELHGQILGTVAIAATVAAPVKLAINYESAMADVKKVTNFDESEFKKFSDDLLTLSTRIPMTAKGLAEIAASAGMAGIAEEEILRFTEDAAVMAVAFDISAAEAGSSMTGLRTNFKLSQDGVISLGDAINQLANNMDATAGEIINFSTRAGRVGTQFGMTGEQVSALGAAMIAMKMPAEVASRATNSLFMKLGTADTAGKDAQEAFRRLGFSGKEMAQAFKKDAQGSLLIFLEAVKRSEDPIKELKAILGEGFADEIAGLVGGIDEYKKALGLLADKSKYSGSMLAEYAARAATTENALELMKNAASRLGIILGSTVLPGITAVANATVYLLEPLASMASAFPGVTTAVFATITALAGLKVAALAGAYASTLISDGYTIAKGVFAALRPSVLINTVAFKAHRVALIALSVGTKILTVAQWALNIAMTANPIGLIVVAVVALAAGFIYLYRNCEPIRVAMDAVWSVVKVIGKNVIKVLLLPFATTCNVIRALWGPLSTWFGNIWTTIKNYAVTVWEKISNVGSTCVSTIKNIFGPICDWFGDIWEGIKAPAVSVFEWIGEKFDWIASKFDWLNDSWSTVTSWFGDDEEQNKTVANNITVAKQETASSLMPSQSHLSLITHGSQVMSTAIGHSGDISTNDDQSQTKRPIQAPYSSPSSPSTINLQPQFNFPINFSGVASKDVAELLIKSMKSSEATITKYLVELLDSIIKKQRRVSYDS